MKFRLVKGEKVDFCQSQNFIEYFVKSLERKEQKKSYGTNLKFGPQAENAFFVTLELTILHTERSLKTTTNKKLGPNIKRNTANEDVLGLQP